MSILTNAAIFFLRLGLSIYFRFGIMRGWSTYYRGVFNKERVPVKSYGSFEELVSVVRKLVWVKDGPGELWDAVAHPEHTQWKIDSGDLRVGDCDEFASYEATAIAASGFVNLEQAPLMMSVCWIVPFDLKVDERMNGHNVCLLKYSDGKYWYMDYGMPVGPFNTLQEVRDSVIGVFCPVTGATSLGFALHDPMTLDLVEASWE